MNPILICITCASNIDIESLELYEWLKIHIHHTIIGDSNSKWFDEWMRGVELDGSDSSSN